jgi:hypothetical protein
MRLRGVAWILCFVGLMPNGAFARKGAPQDSPISTGQVVRIRTGSYAGMCRGYCDSETTIEPGTIRSVSRSFAEKKKYPDVETTRTISKADWNDLQQAVNRSVVTALTGRIGCPGCADEQVEWVEVQFSNRTKKGVAYNMGQGPAAVAVFLQAIKAVESRGTTLVPSTPPRPDRIMASR